MDKLTADLVAQLLKMTQANPNGNQGVWNPMLGILQQPEGGPMWYGEGDLAPYNVASNGMIGEANGDGYVNAYDKEGNFLERSKQKSGAVFSPELLKGAAAAAAMYAGGSGLEGLMGSGAGLGGADAAAGALADAGITGGGYAPALAGGSELGGLEGLISSMGGSPFSLGLEGGALSMPAFGSVLPAAGGLAGAGALTGAGGGASSPSFLDKLGAKSSDFFSNPLNLLNTAGVLGSLYENSKSPDPVNGTTTENKTTTATKTLDPALQSALFGGDGGGLFGQMQGYFAKNPTGQNQTMRDAQSGMRGLLTNPDVLSSLYKAGAAGQGLLTGGANAGAKPWWWRG